MAKSVQINILGSSADALAALEAVGIKAEETASKTDTAFNKSSSSSSSSFLSLGATIGSTVLKVGTLVPALAGVGAAGAALGAGLVGTFAAAGIGAGAFALAAKPVITGIGAASTAQGKYNDAVAQYGPASSQAKSALAQMQMAMGQLTPAEQGAVGQLTNFKDAYKSWSQSFDPQILPVFANGLKIAKTGMADLTPVVQGAGNAFHAVTDQIAASLNSPAVAAGFKNLGGQAQQAIGSLGPVLANIVPAALNLFQALNPVTTLFEGFVSKLGPQLPQLASSLAGPMQGLANMFQTLAPILQDVFGNLGVAIGDVMHALEPLIPTALKFVDALAQLLAVDAGPVFTVLAQAVGGLLTALMPLVPVLGDIILSVVPLIPPIGQLAQVIAGILVIAARTLVPVLQAIIPPIASLVSAVAVSLTPVLNQLAPIIEKLAAQMGGQLAQVITQLAPIVVKLIADLAPMLPALVNLSTMGFRALLPVLELAAKLLQALMPVINPLIGVIVTLVQTVSKVETAVVEFATAWSARWNDIKSIASGAWNDVLKPVLGFVIDNGVHPIRDAINELGTVWGKIWDGIRDAVGAAWSAISGTFNTIVSTVAGLPGRIASAASGMWDSIKDGFRDVINGIIGLWNDLHFTLPHIDLGPLGEIGGGDIGVPQIPYMAAGGIVTAPTLALIGEAGPEAVLPLSGANSPFGGNGGAGGGGQGGDVYLDGTKVGRVLWQSIRTEGLRSTRRGAVRVGLG